MAGPQNRFRTACLLLTALGIALAVFLVSCPRQAPKEAAGAVPAAVPPSSTPAPAAVEPSTSTPAPTLAPVEPSSSPVRPPVTGRMAIVIDDAGYSLAELEPFLRLPIPLAVAVLPNLPNSAEAARRVRAAGKELLLHLPMEPDGGENPGPGALLSGATAEEVERLVDGALASVPGAVGVNNHMGSRATADPALMRDLLAILARRGLFYLDSRTTAETVGMRVSRALGVPALERRVFLDAEPGGGAIERAFALAVAEAARDGWSVAIGHVQTAGLLTILARAPGQLRSAGVAAAAVGELARSGGGGGAAR